MILYPGWRSFFSSLFCYALFQSRKFCGTFFISGLDFYLQDSLTYQQRAVNTGWRETGYLILKVDSLPVGKKSVFTSEEIHLARTAVNQLRNKKIQQGQYTDATDDMLLKLV